MKSPLGKEPIQDNIFLIIQLKKAIKVNYEEWSGFIPNQAREPIGKPGSVGDSHSSGTYVAARLERPTRGPARAAPCCAQGTACPPIWSCSGWGLPCRPAYAERGALLPHLFTLTPGRLSPNPWRYIFCGTFRGLASPRRYLAPYPAEPGLSSAPESLQAPQSRRLSDRLPLSKCV